jgi:hypothetical protein
MTAATCKACSICGKSKTVDHFCYGNRELRSYCLECSKAEKAAYRRGGVVAAREYRARMRSAWRTEA